MIVLERSLSCASATAGPPPGPAVVRAPSVRRRRTTPRSRGRSTTSGGGTARRRRCGSLRPRRSRAPPDRRRRRRRAARCGGTPSTAGRSATRPRRRSSDGPRIPASMPSVPSRRFSGDRALARMRAARETAGPGRSSSRSTERTDRRCLCSAPMETSPVTVTFPACPSTCAWPASPRPTPPAGRGSITRRSTTSASR